MNQFCLQTESMGTLDTWVSHVRTPTEGGATTLGVVVAGPVFVLMGLMT